MNKTRICIVTVPFRLSRVTEINPKLLRHPDRIRVFVIVCGSMRTLSRQIARAPIEMHR